MSHASQIPEKTQIGNVEIDVSNGGYGGDFSFDDTGDLVLAVDTVLEPTATFQRMTRLILTNAATVDDNGTPICEADDIFNDWYGSSVRAEIGEPITPKLLARILGRVNQALATDSGIVQSPAPIVSVTSDNVASVFINIAVTLVTGKTVVYPTIILNTQTGQVASSAAAVGGSGGGGLSPLFQIGPGRGVP